MIGFTLTAAGIGLAASTLVVTATSQEADQLPPEQGPEACQSVPSGYQRVAFERCVPKRERGSYPKGDAN